MNITEYSPKDLFWIPKKLRHLLHLSNPFLINTLNIWNSWKSKLICQYSPSTPLSSIDWQSPDLKKVIETWKTHGVSKLKDILVKTSVITKRELEEKTESNLMWLHYFQLRSRLDQRDIQEHLQGGGEGGRETPFDILLALEDDSTKHKLSTIYHILIDAVSWPNTYLIKKWDQDCSLMDDERLSNSFPLTTLTVTNIFPIKIQLIKLLYRWYITPALLFKRKLKPSDGCWERCHQRADYIHWWWSCPLIQSFWQEVILAIQGITDFKLHNLPSVLLLNLCSEELVPSSKRRIVSILLSLAKTEIASRWKAPKQPDVSSWYDRIWKSFLLLNITDRILKLSTPTYRSTLECDWFPIFTYMSQKNIVFSKYYDITFRIF